MKYMIYMDDDCGAPTYTVEAESIGLKDGNLILYQDAGMTKIALILPPRRKWIEIWGEETHESNTSNKVSM